MSKCDDPFFKECERCNIDDSGECIAEQEILGRVLKKLDQEEIMLIMWLLAKAKGAGEWTVEEFAEAVAKAVKQVNETLGRFSQMIIGTTGR